MVKYKYVFFDFDGTLADTEEVNFAIYQKLFYNVVSTNTCKVIGEW